MLLIKNKTIRLTLGLLETINFLHLKLWLKNRAHARGFSGRVFRDYMSLVKQDVWRSQTIDELLPKMKENCIVLEHLQGGGIYTSIDELAYLALITRNLRPARIFEIGTFRGRTALTFALNSPPECVVYTLDLPALERTEFKRRTNPADTEIIEKSLTGIDYQGKPGSEKIRQLFGDSTTYDFSGYYGQMDLVFVDGAHHFEAVVSDTRNALKLVRDEGWVIWHDFANYGDYNDVTRAVIQLLPKEQVVQIENSQLAVYRKPSRK